MISHHLDTFWWHARFFYFMRQSCQRQMAAHPSEGLIVEGLIAGIYVTYHRKRQRDPSVRSGVPVNDEMP
jgi:hypothetical protein